MSELVMATIVEPDAHVDDGEAEPVIVEHAGTETTLVLDDGRRLVFDRQELVAALEYTPARAERAA